MCRLPYLTLAGHTTAPGEASRSRRRHQRSRAPLRWSHGLVVEGGRHLIVTAGLGTGGIPLRIGVPPEFVLIEVTGASVVVQNSLHPRRSPPRNF